MTQKRLKDGRRDRISVSLDPDDFKWIQSFKGPSDSYTVSRIIRAARLQGLTLEEAKTGGVLEEFAQWLSKRKKVKLAADLHDLLAQFLKDK